MGSGSWSSSVYSSTASTRAATGAPTMAHTHAIKTGAVATSVHKLLDPSVTAGDSSPFSGKIMREVAITNEHPEPTPIAIVLDVTGSNYEAATVVHEKLPLLFGLLQRKAIISDPQINMCATGDATCDTVPLQVGQFESDNRIEEQLEQMYLEGGGGGGNHETYELAAYFLARHTNLEPYEKQGRRGYAFFIGDEKPYDQVRADQVREYIGNSLQDNVSTKEIFDELTEKYETFYLFQKQGSYEINQVVPTWRNLLGERALILEDPNTICETIAGIIGMIEGGLSIDEVGDTLTEVGADTSVVESVSKTLATVSGSGAGGIVTVEGDLPASSDDSDVTRL